MYTVLSNARTLWRNTKQIGVSVMPMLKLENGGLTINQVRLFAARRGKRAKMLAAKREKKLEEAAKPKAIPKYLARKTKQHTGKERQRVTDENWLEAAITDDIWRLKLCRGKPYSVADAISLLQELHHPTMLNDHEAFVYATVELNLQLKKKNQFMDEFAGTIFYPHDFESGSRKRVVVLCQNSDDQFKASEAGAAYVGGLPLIQRILHGEITSDDYDFVVCHPEMLKDCNKLRGLLKKKFPTMANGFLRLDVDVAVREFSKCTEYASNASTLELDFGWIDVCFGRLNMTHEQLEDNLKKLLTAVERKKPAGVGKSMFITRTLLWCEKSSEKFKIPHWEYLPGYPENGVPVSDDPEEDEEKVSEVKG